jgi:hypothetical protein
MTFEILALSPGATLVTLARVALIPTLCVRP